MPACHFPGSHLFYSYRSLATNGWEFFVLPSHFALRETLSLAEQTAFPYFERCWQDTRGGSVKASRASSWIDTSVLSRVWFDMSFAK